jgi:4-hydroxysphinganine ceramide fatty acyl 2-hydroxylase
MTEQDKVGEKSTLLIIDSKVYDVTSFVDRHPGGKAILMKYAGQDVTVIMRGTKGGHVHSEAAMDMLCDYYVGEASNITATVTCSEKELHCRVSRRHKTKYGVDIDQPLVPQVWNLDPTLYQQWINDPLPGAVRLMKSDWIEHCTKTRWYAIPCFWLPLLLTAFYYIWGQLPAWKIGLLFLFGEITWSIVEYSLHRFVFHFTPRTFTIKNLVVPVYLLQTMHFLLHGIHHIAPMDDGRLVAPIPMAVTGFSLVVLLPLSPFAFALYYLNRALFATAVLYMLSFVSGFASGYLVYDLTHYYLHHGEPMNKYFQILKSNHMKHHYQHHDKHFGVSGVLMDFIGSTGN